MNGDLSRLEQLYDCRFYRFNEGGQEYLELCSKNKFSKNNIAHIEHLMKQYGYYFYMVEAVFDDLIITYYKK